MQTIDVIDLANVTGGTAQPASAEGATSQTAAPGGDFLSGFQQFLSFLQSPGFQQILGSLQGLIGQLGAPQGAAPQASTSTPAPAAPAAQG